MNRILSAARLDFLASKSSLRLTFVLLIVAAVIGIMTHGMSYAMLLIMIFAVTSCGSVFPAHEKSHSEKLYGILPLKKSEMIIGRYLYALFIGAIYVAIAAVLGLVISRLGGEGDAVTYLLSLSLAFLYFCFAVGVSYPIYLRFTFAKANIFTMLPMYLIAVAFLIISRRTDISGSLGQVINFFANHLYLAPIFGVLGGLILLTVSIMIANLIYKRKEI